MLRLSMPALLLALAGCATKPPANPDNLCEIFREKPKWHEAALKMQQRWGAPVQVPMAMMYQESSFKHDALPPRYYFLGFIPWGRVSSAYGYAQAKDETWADYKREAGGWGASPANARWPPPRCASAPATWASSCSSCRAAVPPDASSTRTSMPT